MVTTSLQPAYSRARAGEADRVNGRLVPPAVVFPASVHSRGAVTTTKSLTRALPDRGWALAWVWLPAGNRKGDLARRLRCRGASFGVICARQVELIRVLVCEQSNATSEQSDSLCVMTGGTMSEWVAFWDWAGERGQMNKSTARARRVAVTEVLDAIGAEDDDLVRDLDVEDALRRFENLRSSKFTPRSLATYQSRFRKAHEEYVAYLSDRGSWRPAASRRRASTGQSAAPRSSASSTVEETARTVSAGPVGEASRSQLMDYPFPIREGVVAVLRLPIDLTGQEAERLTKYLEALAMPKDLSP